MIVYKVVLKEEGKLVSAWARGEWQETYVPGEWTYPLHGKTGLFAFAHQLDALDWCCSHVRPDSWELWEAEAEDPTPVPKRIPSVRRGGVKLILAWWKGLRMNTLPHSFDSWYGMGFDGEYLAMQEWHMPAFWCVGIRLTKQLSSRS